VKPPAAEHPRAVCIYFGWHFARSRAAMNAVVIAKAIAMRGTRVTSGHHATQRNPTNHRSKKKPKRRIDSHSSCHLVFHAAPFG